MTEGYRVLAPRARRLLDSHPRDPRERQRNTSPARTRCVIDSRRPPLNPTGPNPPRSSSLSKPPAPSLAQECESYTPSIACGGRTILDCRNGSRGVAGLII